MFKLETQHQEMYKQLWWTFSHLVSNLANKCGVYKDAYGIVCLTSCIKKVESEHLLCHTSLKAMHVAWACAYEITKNEIGMEN